MRPATCGLSASNSMNDERPTMNGASAPKKPFTGAAYMWYYIL
nr:MAG TPA: hypothetical protein [Bacteriophage sp.]